MSDGNLWCLNSKKVISVGIKPPSLITYPRSGSHYFHELFYRNTRTLINRSHGVMDVLDHNKNKIKQIITIVRDPKETLWSLIGVQEHYGHMATEGSIKQDLSDYSLLCNFLFEYADFVVDFNDLVNFPELTMNKILKELKINQEVASDADMNNYKKITGDRYVKSSKTLLEYKEKSFDNFNLGLCYYEYNKLLTRKIDINKND